MLSKMGRAPSFQLMALYWTGCYGMHACIAVPRTEGLHAGAADADAGAVAEHDCSGASHDSVSRQWDHRTKL